MDSVPKLWAKKALKESGIACVQQKKQDRTMEQGKVHFANPSSSHQNSCSHCLDLRDALGEIMDLTTD